MIRSNPADRVERPRKEKFKSEVYKAEELEQLFTAIQGDPAEFGVIMAAFYGLRRSEIKCRSCRTKKESPHFLSGIPYGLANGGGSRFRSILWQGRAVRPTHTPQIKKELPQTMQGLHKTVFAKAPAMGKIWRDFGHAFSFASSSSRGIYPSPSYLIWMCCTRFPLDLSGAST